MSEEIEKSKGPGIEQSGQETDNFSNTPKMGSGKTKIISIGIDRYKHEEYWEELKYPVSDCKRLLQVLKRYHTADIVRELYDDKAYARVVNEELELLREDREQETIEESDTVIIIFSGHGYLPAKSKIGRWVLSDAEDPKKSYVPKEQMINLDEVVDILSFVKARHVLLIVDACYGEKFADRTIPLPTACIPASGKNDDNASRWILTSGRDGKVPDRSLFMHYLAEFLVNNTESEISVKELEIYIRRKIGKGKSYKPFSKNLVPNEYDGGEFYFHLSQKAATTTDSAQRMTTLTDFLMLLRVGSQRYREILYEGRFRYVRIEEVLLPHTDHQPLTEVSLEINDTTRTLQGTLEYLWKEEVNHALILGDGGMGKTMSVLRIWERLVDNSAYPVPIFVALNEYNLAKNEQRSYFITRYIARHYLGINEVDQELREKIWEFFEVKKGKGSLPGIVILLDGLNEVTADRLELNNELLSLSSEGSNVQLVVTSRFGAVEGFSWTSRFHQTKLLPLEKVTVDGYLSNTDRETPHDREIYRLLTNPMMLTIYAHTEQLGGGYKSDRRFDFKHPVNREAELLWNFREAQLLKLWENAGDSPSEEHGQEKDFQIFLLKYLVPYVAWRMEKAGQFFITDRIQRNADFNFDGLIIQAFQDLDREGLDNEFSTSWKYFLGGRFTDSVSESIARTRKIRKYLVEHLHIFVPEGDDLRFLHQNFRDFYAACHLLNCIKFTLAEGKRPEEWKERALPIYLRKMIGELEGEHLFDPSKMLELNNDEPPERIKENELSKLLNQCRGPIGMMEDYTVWNAITIVNETRDTLAGADLSNLDLCGLVLNRLRFSLRCDTKYLTAKVNGAKVMGKQFLFDGHTDVINIVVYSPDGKRILSASEDGTLREWSSETGACLKTFKESMTPNATSAVYSPDGRRILSAHWNGTLREWSSETGNSLNIFNGHSWGFTFATYSPDGKRILSASEDGTLLEWSSETGACLNALKGHTKRVTSAAYSPDGKHIVSASWDRTLREWLSETDACLQTFKGHTNEVVSTIYSPEGKRILSASWDGTLREWSTETGACLQTFKGDKYEGKVTSADYSPDGKRIISAYWDGMLREWSSETGACLQTFKGHSWGVTFATYSPDGKRIVSASEDWVLREWSAETGTCLQVFEGGGYKRRANSVAYSPDGKRIVSASWDGSLREWSSETGVCLQVFEGGGYRIRRYSAGYSPDRKRIVFDYFLEGLREWSKNKDICLHAFEANSPDKKGIVSASENWMLLQWYPGMDARLEVFEEQETGIKTRRFIEDPGLHVHGLDLRNLHPDSVFTEEEKSRLRRYGAIFDDQDKADWEATVEDAYGTQSDD